MTNKANDLVRHFYPEFEIGEFTRVSATAEFLFRVGALLKPTDRLLDYGAGRGAYIEADKTGIGRQLKIFRGRVAHVEGCDIDPAVLDNPYLDHATVIDPEMPLPYSDHSFDIIVSNWVFEHINNPAFVAEELMRVLKPGGHICAITPNKLGYIALAARLTGNSNHVPLLKRIQPSRRDFDVFPTRYRLNTKRAIRKYFASADVIVVFTASSEPAYHFNSSLVYRMFKLLHKVTPGPLRTTLMIFLRKGGRTETQEETAAPCGQVL